MTIIGVRGWVIAALIAAIALIAISLSTRYAGAQQSVYRDAQGRTIGTATTTSGTTVYRDERGRTTGSSNVINGMTIYRDTQGRVQGTKSK
jgi:hypothetical protein